MKYCLALKSHGLGENSYLYRDLDNMRHRTRDIIVLVTAALVVAWLFCLPRRLFDKPVCAVLESGDGTLMGARIAADGQWRFPAVDTVPEKFAQAIITYEDKRFRWHPGVDPLAVGRAIRLNARSGEVRSGASTITMQVIRLSRGARRRSIGEKMIEAVQATRLELRCSKDRILALYASNAPFGGNVVGLEAAAWRYFGRPADELSWGESAMLAVLPNAPALIHPGKNREMLLEKRNTLLDKLFEAGKIDSDECMLAKCEPLPDKPCPMPDIAYHHLETLRAAGGDRLYRTSLDYALQMRAEAILARHSQDFRTNEVFNAAALIIDVRSGEPLVYCGNVRGGEGGNGYDVDVVNAPRSSGSTLKPFLYAAMLDEGSILPRMLIADTPFHYKDFTPNNFSHSFDGAVPACDVIRRSLNVPAVRMLQQYGIDNFITVLKRMGITTVNRGADTYGLSLILGGAEITLWDIARAYRLMAVKLDEYSRPPENGYGRSAEPVAERARKQTSGKDIPLSAGAIWCTFDVLSEVSRPEEEGDWQYFNSTRKVAWKTGTSFGNRDAWSVGVTPDYIVAVWVGNCDGVGRPLLTGVGYAAPVMFDLFNLLPPTGWFYMPEMDLEEVATCPSSGHPLSEICLSDPAYCDADTVLAPVSKRRPQSCPYHRTVHLSPDGQYRVDSDCCSVSDMRTEAWFVLPPAQEWYYMQSHSGYRQLPPLHPDIQGASGSGLLEIIYPQSGMALSTPIALDSRSRGIVFSAAHSDPDATLYWHLDGDYLGLTAHGEHKIKAVPEPGSHTLTITDPNGNNASVRFTVK